MAKSVLLTYLFWLIGGWFGLHHFYLRRDRHAFVWWCTAGGVFGIGLFRDLFRIPEYVDDANDEKQFIVDLKYRMRRSQYPPFNTVRFLGEMVMGMLFGFLFRTAIPEELLQNYSALRVLEFIVPYAVAVGVHVVANIGREKATMRIAVIGAYCAMPLYLFFNYNIFYLVLGSIIALQSRGVSWRLHKEKGYPFCARLMLLMLCCSLYSALWGCNFYNNAYVTTQYGEKIRLKDALANFFTSPAWQETKDTMYKIWERMQTQGFWTVYDEVVMALDPEGETHSYRVLGLTSRASEQELKAAYRKLAKEWHPDRHSDPEKKKEAEQKFMEIQKAYETLSDIDAKRKRKNLRDPGRHTYHS